MVDPGDRDRLGDDRRPVRRPGDLAEPRSKRGPARPPARRRLSERPLRRRGLASRAIAGIDREMIAFASAITKPEVYERCAATWLRRSPPSPTPSVIAVSARRLDLPQLQPAPRPGPRARRPRGLVLVHQDAEITDPEFCAQAARARSPTPRSRSIGCAGATGQRSIAWWEGVGHLGVVRAPLRGVRRRRDPGDELPGRRPTAAFARTGEVDCDRRGRDRRCRRGRSASCASTSRSAASCTATTSTSAAGARGGQEGRDRGPAGSSTTTRSS